MLLREIVWLSIRISCRDAWGNLRVPKPGATDGLVEIAVGLMPLQEALEFKGPGSKEFEVGLDLFREVPLKLREFLEGFASPT